jgi:hypothetical protein
VRRILLTAVVLGATGVAHGAQPARGRALVACIENANPIPLLDRIFEAIGAEDLRPFAARYDRAAVLTHCGFADLARALARARPFATDVAILAHGSPHGILLRDGFVARARLASLGALNPNLRIVFQLNCWGSRLAATWRRAGARAVVSARRLNMNVLAHRAFFRAWTGGATVRAASASVNETPGLLAWVLRATERLVRDGGSREVDSRFEVSGDAELMF